MNKWMKYSNKWHVESIISLLVSYTYQDQRSQQRVFGEVLRLTRIAQFSSVQSLSRVRLFATPWTAAHQASLSITNSRSPPKPMSIESMMPSNHSSSVIPFSSCSQSFLASGSFPVSQLFAQVAQVLEFQLQHQSFQWTPRTDLL